MIRALWTASSGMYAQQLNVDTIANNLSNVNTAGFKKNRVDFQELFYETLRPAANAGGEEQAAPGNIYVGYGVRAAATAKLFSQGPLQPTDNPLDLAIEGDGFFQVTLGDGTVAYTRSGVFKLSGDGRIVTSDGYYLQYDGEGLPENATEISIGEDGRITATVEGEAEGQEMGQILLVRFVNPAGLEAMGRGLFRETQASGPAAEATEPGTGGCGTIQQGVIEMSNVQIVEEMVNLIVAQRAYEINAKSIQTSDELLSLANNLRR